MSVGVVLGQPMGALVAVFLAVIGNIMFRLDWRWDNKPNPWSYFLVRLERHQADPAEGRELPQREALRRRVGQVRRRADHGADVEVTLEVDDRRRQVHHDP